MTYLSLVRDFLGLRLSQRRFIAERYGVTRLDATESDLEFCKRAIVAVADQKKQDEFAALVAAAKSRD